MADAGVTPPGEIIADDRIHRYAPDPRRRGKLDYPAPGRLPGWLVAGPPAGHHRHLAGQRRALADR